MCLISLVTNDEWKMLDALHAVLSDLLPRRSAKPEMKLILKYRMSFSFCDPFQSVRSHYCFHILIFIASI